MRAPATSAIQTDNDVVRITEWRLPPGGATGHHRHEYDYAVVPITGGELTVVSSAGTTRNPLTSGQSYFRGAGVEHDVQNQTEREIVFIEIEIKDRAG
jgi:quercetin dioxygenase-like cupin family protein